MCGLVGIYSSDITAKHKDVLASLLYLDTWRGRDSTGVAAIRKNGDTATLKQTIPGYEFVDGPKLGAHLHLSDVCWIGHNRFGTIGKATKGNAHPFEIDDKDGDCVLVGAHNGTLTNKYVLTEDQSFGTDSEALFNEIAISGLEDTIAKVEGAWALSYFDHYEEELRFIRNKERTLFYAYEDGHKTLFWASEAWMIRIAVSRSGLKLEEDKVYSFEEDTLYRFPLPIQNRDVLTCETKGGVVGKQKTTGFFRGGKWRERGGSYGQEKHSQTTPQRAETAKTTPAAPRRPLTSQSSTTNANVGAKLPLPSAISSDNKSSLGDNVRPILSGKTYRGFGGVPLSKRELEDILAGGCKWCEIEFLSADTRHGWLADGAPVCAKCLDGKHEVEERKVAIH